MNTENWNNINIELDKIYLEIFRNTKVNELDTYTKRKLIFEYMCNNIKYDYLLLDQIKFNRVNLESKIVRNPYSEIESIFKYKKGICNGISQVYKLLLEKVNIYSLCVICDDYTNIRHQLNLVYNNSNKTFSFDDITSVIVNRGSIEDFFDYDMEDAIHHKQGCREIFDNKYWYVLPTDYVYMLVGRKNFEYLKYGIENSPLPQLPQNIVSVKKLTKNVL